MQVVSRFPKAPQTKTKQRISLIRSCTLLVLVTYWITWGLSILCVPIVTIVGYDLWRLLVSPVRFDIYPESLRIIWLLNNKLIPLKQIVSVKKLSQAELVQYMRKSGTPEKKILAYVSQPEDAILINIEQHPAVLLSPVESDQFIQALKIRVPKLPIETSYTAENITHSAPFPRPLRLADIYPLS